MIQHLERTHKQTSSPLLFDAKFYLYKLNRDYDNALKVAIKRADPDLLFDFLYQQKLDLNLKEFLSKLLMIDAQKTIQYLLMRSGNQIQATVHLAVTILRNSEE